MRNRTSRTCTALNKRGTPCGSAALKNLLVCSAHNPDPQHQEKLQAARSKGGKVTKYNRDRTNALIVSSLTNHQDGLKTSEDVREFLSKLVDAVNLEKLTDMRLVGQLGFLCSGVLAAIKSMREDALATAEQGGTRLIILEADEAPAKPLPERDPELLARLAGTPEPIEYHGPQGVIRGNNVRGNNVRGARRLGLKDQED